MGSKGPSQSLHPMSKPSQSALTSPSTKAQEEIICRSGRWASSPSDHGQVPSSPDLGPLACEVAVVTWYGFKGTVHPQGLGRSRHLAPVPCHTGGWGRGGQGAGSHRQAHHVLCV